MYESTYKRNKRIANLNFYQDVLGFIIVAIVFYVALIVINLI